MKKRCWFGRGRSVLSGLLLVVLALKPGIRVAAAPAHEPDRVLFDFTQGVDSSKVVVQDATVSKSGSGTALHVVTGHAQP